MDYSGDKAYLGNSKWASKVVRGNKQVNALNTPVVVPAGSTILTDAFEVAGFENIYIRLQGNATQWKIKYRSLYDISEPGSLSPQNSMRSPREFSNTSNVSQGYLAVSSPYVKLAISNMGANDAQLHSLKIFCQ